MTEVQVALVVDVRKCCRLCLVADEKQTYGNIFKDSVLTENNVSIVEALHKVTGLVVSEDGGLPERICNGCWRKLEDSFRFINEVVSNNAILVELVNPETMKVERTKYALELGDDSESEQSAIPEANENEKQRNTRKKQRETTLTYIDDDQSGTYSDEESAAPASADELDAVNLILKNFANQREAKHKTPFRDSRRRIHKCTDCEKVFLRKSNLIDHQRFHSQTKLFQCEYCDKSFVQSGNLAQHLRTHTAEKPYSCTFCSKSFSQSGALKTHMNIHLQRRPFECSTCTKAFTSGSDLKRHRLTHDRKKRFCCPMCSDRVFTQKVHLRMHLTRIHPHCNVEEMVTLGTTDNPGSSLPRDQSPSPPTTLTDFGHQSSLDRQARHHGKNAK
ncbi:zinc finger protein 501-like [Anopheles darlingi]|uniref:zinc finger protein 501-like n=1 Tax=Anopheles darlingi TaxID=43151 RepID=UPI00210007B8|nr:zinc finger protein 501-like [Anopheles darlingi]